MKKTFLTSLSVLFLFFSVKTETVNLHYIDSVFQSAFLSKKFNGAVAILSNNQIIYNKKFGKENYEKNIALTDSSRFQIASISKQFTCSAILILEQKGKLSTDDYVCQYLPDFPYKKVKIIHLMNHTSGMPNFQKTMLSNLDKNKINGNSQMLHLLKTGNYKQQWKEGEKWEYSDIAFCTLATLIEKISGRDFKTFMAQNIFIPAQMHHTTAEFYTDSRLVHLKNLCQGYEFNNNKYVIAYNELTNNYVRMLGGFYGDGSVYSTAEDMLKWFQALMKDDILTQESKKKLFQPTRLNSGKLAVDYGFHYGLGWYIGENKKLGTFFGENKKLDTFYFHPGGQAGFCSKFIICPNKNIAIIILSNLNNIDFYSFTNIYKHILK